MTAIYKISKIYNKLLHLQLGVLICAILLTAILYSRFFNLIPGNEGALSYSIYSHQMALNVLLALVLSPLLETLIFQYFIIKLVQRFRWNNTIAVFISASLFGVAHYYNIRYIIFAFFLGLIFGTAFILFQLRKNKSYLWICLIHFLYNLFVLLSAFIPYMLDPHRKPLNWDWWF